MSDDTRDALEEVVLEAIAEVQAELDELMPTIERLLTRAAPLLSVVTWDERYEEQPPVAERLHSTLYELGEMFLAGRR